MLSYDRQHESVFFGGNPALFVIRNGEKHAVLLSATPQQCIALIRKMREVLAQVVAAPGTGLAQIGCSRPIGDQTGREKGWPNRRITREALDGSIEQSH